MEENNNIFDEGFLSKLSEIDMSKDEVDAIYYYLSLFSETMTDEELVFWGSILEKKDPDYNNDDEEDDDIDS